MKTHLKAEEKLKLVKNITARLMFEDKNVMRENLLKVSNQEGEQTTRVLPYNARNTS